MPLAPRTRTRLGLPMPGSRCMTASVGKPAAAACTRSPEGPSSRLDGPVEHRLNFLIARHAEPIQGANEREKGLLMIDSTHWRATTQRCAPCRRDTTEIRCPAGRLAGAERGLNTSGTP